MADGMKPMTDDFRINMICCTDTICDEVKIPELTQKDIALSYAMALKSQADGVDKPDWGRVTKLHHTHACQTCGHVWRPAIVNTVGVQFLPGFKDEPNV